MEIVKFRAWDQVEKRFIQDDETVLEFISAKFAEPAQITLGTFNRIFRDNKYITWLLFTNHTDRNGKEIYEGDIIRDQGELFAVRWDRHLSQFALYTHDNERPKGSNKEWRFEDGLSSAKEYEIVGNLYENPELLEEDES